MFSSLNRRRGKMFLGKGGGGGGSGTRNNNSNKAGSSTTRQPSSSSYHRYEPPHQHPEEERSGIPSATSASTMLDDHEGSIHGIRSLIGGSGGVSLDGQSLAIPPSSVVVLPDNDGSDDEFQHQHPSYYDDRTALSSMGGGASSRPHNPGSPSMDNSIDMYSYTLSAPGGAGTHDGDGGEGDELTDEEQDNDLENGGGGRVGADPAPKERKGGRRGWGAAGCGAGNNFLVVGDDDDDDDDNNNKEDEEEGSASAAMIMMGMSTNNHIVNNNANTSNVDGTIDQSHSDIAASSSASALFDGRSLQISSNEDDDMSSINSSSIYQGQQQQQQQLQSGMTPTTTARYYYDGGEASSSLSSPPPLSQLGCSPSPATSSNKYLGPYGSKLKIIGSINLLNDVDNDKALPNSQRDVGASSLRIVQGPVGRGGGVATQQEGGTAREGGDDLESAVDKPTPFCGCRCAPLWIQRSPRWLQIVLFASAVFALLAIALVAVSVSLAFHARASASAADAATGGSDDAPFVPPVVNNGTSTGAPDPINGTSSNNSNGTLNNITNVPITNTTTPETPVDWSSLLRTSFAVTAGRYPDALAEIVPDLLPNFTTTLTVNTATIPGDATGGEGGPQTSEVESWLQFMVNLGDWNSPAYTDCVEAAYEDVADMFSTSAVPVLFVPGDNEYNDCTGQEQEALNRWRNTLVDYESSHWTLPFTTETRQVDSFVENFAFVYRQVIFVGLNLVSGNVYNQDMWDARLAADLEWVEQAYDAYHNVTRAMVLFSHSSPDNTLNAAFFDPLLANVSSSWTDLEFVIMHRNNPGQVMEQTLQYSGIANLQVVSVLGSVWPPLRATVMIDTTTESGAGVTVQVQQDTLYQETPQE